MEIEINGSTFLLLPEKAVFWLEKGVLILADIHLGKAGHFRKAGIPIPKAIHLGDFETLEVLLNSHPVKEVVVVGDLFHSELNLDWLHFTHWLEQHPEIKFKLVLGNHDILNESQYQHPNLERTKGALHIDNFIFHHEPIDSQLVPEGKYLVAGHIHPSVRIGAGAKQSFRVPCFCFGKKVGILPAFGKFTGMGTLQFSKEQRIFAIADEKVIAIAHRLIKNN